LMVQLFSFGGVFPIEQMPQPFRWLQALMPLTYARNALRMTLSGYYGPRFWFAVLVLLALVAWRARSCADAPVRSIASLLFMLVIAQAVIGVANVLLGIPVWVSAMHLANAAFMLALSLVATFRLSVQPAPARAFAQAVAR